MRERALARESLTPHQLSMLRRQMDEARARRLQPYYIELFFRDAFKRLGGRISRREQGRHEIANVPATIRSRQRPGAALPSPPATNAPPSNPTASTPTTPAAPNFSPGHPLMDTVLDATIESHRGVLEAGTLLFDPPTQAPNRGSSWR